MSSFYLYDQEREEYVEEDGQQLQLLAWGGLCVKLVNNNALCLAVPAPCAIFPGPRIYDRL